MQLVYVHTMFYYLLVAILLLTGGLWFASFLDVIDWLLTLRASVDLVDLGLWVRLICANIYLDGSDGCVHGMCECLHCFNIVGWEFCDFRIYC
eukprot:gene3061-2043_t